MNQQLITQLTEKAGLSKEQAQEALKTVSAYVGENLPPEFAGVITGFLDGTGDLSALTDLASKLPKDLGSVDKITSTFKKLF